MPNRIFLSFLLRMHSYVLYHKDYKSCNITLVHTLTKHIIFSGNICLTITMWWNKKIWVLRAKRVWCLHFYWRPSIPPSKYCNVTFTETLLHKKKAVACPVYYTCIYVFIPLVIVPTVNVRVFENLAQQISSIGVFSKRRKLWASKIKEKLIANEAYAVITE